MNEEGVTPELGFLRLPGEADSVGRGRRFVTGILASTGVADDQVFSLELIASELLTNAVLHAHSEVSIRVVGDRERIRLEVSDAAAQLPVPRDPNQEAATGRGLEIIAALASDFGVSPHASGGKTVWAAVDLSPEQEQAPAGPRWPVPEVPVADATLEITIVLDHLPWQLYEVIRERNEGLLRDFALHRLEHPGDSGPSPEQISLAGFARQPLRDAVTTAVSAFPDGQPVPARIDVEFTVDRDRLPAFAALRTVLAAADDLAERGLLLTAPTLPELRAVQEWYFDQIAAQSDGTPSQPWQPRALPDEETEPRRTPAPPGVVPDARYPIVLADNNNRITAVTPPIEALLGWRPEDLLGQRLVVLIPPELREQHVVGFTRFLATGRSAILGRELALDAWHRDGRPVRVTLTIRQHHAGRITYYAADFASRDS